MKVGALVKDKHTKQRGTVLSVDLWENEPPSIENHGCITVCLDNGREEHYVYFQWEKHLKLIEGSHS